MIQTPTFDYKPFSKKQRQILNWWTESSPVKDKFGIIADGAIRSGKSLCMSLSFCLWAMHDFKGQNFAMCGKTVGSFRRNVLHWLKIMLTGRGYTVFDKRADNLVIVSDGENENYFYIFGGRDERSQDLIQGVTLAGLYLDEVALMPQSFVNQATARCSVANAKMWFNCNPSHPSHWFKTEWIDKAKEKEILYLHFLMDDNLSLSEKVKERYKKQYTGVFYDRYIRGIWSFAEGVIYRTFADDMAGEKHMLIPRAPQMSRINIGVDFGGSSSAHTFVCTGTDRGFSNLYALASERVECKDSNGMQIDIDPEKLGQLFCDFVERVIMMYGVPDRVYCDSAEQTLILGLRATARKRGLGWLRIENALKTSINDRIRTVHRLMAQGRFFVVDHGCESLIKALQEAVWNPRAVTEDERLDDGTSDIDTLDAFEYTFERDISRYIKLE